MSYEKSRALNNTSQTAFAVAIICLVFVAETMQISRGHPQAAAAAILSVLAVVGVSAVVRGVYFYRRAKSERTTD